MHGPPAATLPRRGEHSHAPTWFRFGDGYLGVTGDDDSFRERFVDQYGECLSEECPPNAPVVMCRVHSAGGRVEICFDDPEPLDQMPFALRVLRDLEFAENGEADGEMRTIASPFGQRISLGPSRVIADESAPWQNVVGPLAMHRVMRLQRHVLFLHAGSASISGRGLLLVGPKEAGKTTISMAIAAHGHAFYGDEMAAVRLESVELIPFRKRLSIRRGPSAAAVAAMLSREPKEEAQLTDGTWRTHAQAHELFPPARRPVPLHTIFFLRSKGAVPRVEPFSPSAAHLGLITPFESEVWSEPRALVAMRLLRLLGRVRCLFLDLGPVDETVRVIEHTMRES